MQFLFVYLNLTFFQEGLKMAYGDVYANTSKFTWAEKVEAKIKSVRKKDGTSNTFSIKFVMKLCIFVKSRPPFCLFCSDFFFLIFEIFTYF